MLLKAAIPAIRLFGLACAISIAGCATNPATGQRQLSLIGEGQEIAMGRESDPGIVQSMGLYDDAQLQSYIQQLGGRLAAASERPALPWTFRVIDDPVVNAFAVPGGFIYITRGIMEHLNSEAQLAAVVGHEIGHVTARHSVSQMSRAQLAQAGLVAGVILGGEKVAPLAGLASQGMQVLFLKFGRDDETQADELGLRYLRRLNYDPRPMVGVFDLLGRVSQAHGGGRVPEWLSTHPDPANRAGRIQALIASAPVPPGQEVGRDSYLARLDGTVYGDDPRQGFFRDNRFFHPTLRFQLAFPPGWKTANQREAVIAVSPTDDAMMELRLAAQTPEEAAAAFFGQQGITGSASRRTSTNQMPTVAGDFRAATEAGGSVDGTVAFVAYGSSTFRLLAYGATSAWPRYTSAAQTALRSFDRVTDPAVLGTKPLRLRIVTLDRAMTLEQFNQRYPSEASLPDVALLNQVEPGVQLASGTKLKRVVRQ